MEAPSMMLSTNGWKAVPPKHQPVKASGATRMPQISLTRARSELAALSWHVSRGIRRALYESFLLAKRRGANLRCVDTVDHA
eukprot:9034007-Pyramimonas_sp.AAC.1